MGIDRRYVKRLLGEIEQHLVLLETARCQSQEELFADPLRALGGQHALQIIIEAVLSVSHQMIAGLNLPRPERNIDAPLGLLKAGVLQDGELAARLPSMVRFRNLLVHRYWEVKLELVYEILHKHLRDVRQFVQEVSRYLASTEAETD